MIRTALLLFGKVPRPGQVKTRLARSIGDEAAAALAEAFLRDASRNYARIAGCDPVVAAESASDEFWAREFPPPWRVEDQGDGDLGERLERAFRREFASYERVAAVGADHPDLASGELSKFVSEKNAVWPTRDGGYAAIVLSRSSRAPELFRDIEWSTASVLSRTLERARERGIDLALAPETADVDVEADLEGLCGRLSQRDPAEADFPARTWRELSRLARPTARP